MVRNGLTITSLLLWVGGLISSTAQVTQAESQTPSLHAAQSRKALTLDSKISANRPNRSTPINPIIRQSQLLLGQGEPDSHRFPESSPIPVPVPPPNPPAQPQGLPKNTDQETNQTTSGQKSGWAIAPEVSTLGLGGTIINQISPNFNGRLGVNTFGFGIDVSETEFTYEGDLNLFNVSTLIDFHPIKKSGFRLSGGLVLSNNNINGTADISEQVADELGEVELAGQVIDIRNLNIENLATIDADIEINRSVAPYLGIGGGNAVGANRGLGLWWNLGVVFGGAPEVEVSSNVSEAIPSEIRSEVESTANQILAEEEQELEEELDIISFYPVASLGFSYQF